MTDYIQYHKIHQHGQPTSVPGDFKAFTDKPVKNMIGKRVWLVSGEKQFDKHIYHLEYVFTVEAVEPGAPNVMRGSEGTKLDKPINLNGYPWFEALKKKRANFSLGLGKVDDEVVAEFERLIGFRSAFGGER